MTELHEFERPESRGNKGPRAAFPDVDFTGDGPVNHPKHYGIFPDTEALDVIKKVLTPSEYIGYLKGNILKYRLRAGKKGDAKLCIRKADNYSKMLDEVMD